METNKRSTTGRDREKPLFPVPFEKTTISTEVQNWDSNDPLAKASLAKAHGIVCPGWTKRLHEDEARSDLSALAKELRSKAQKAELFDSSESRWELDARKIVFGRIDDDPALEVDKRLYHFHGEGNRGEQSREQRTPDLTMGIKTYSSKTEQSSRDDGSGRVDEKKRRILSRARLEVLVKDKNGLVVDGNWKKAELVFPFAVYEAKKDKSSLKQAQKQAYQACQVYVAMLDDLARNAMDVQNYRKRGSWCHQIFCFISCGSYWQVAVAWSSGNTCHIETIWDGNVTKRRDSYELICIIDQVHHYAVTTHLEFVTEHLEPWHWHIEGYGDKKSESTSTNEHLQNGQSGAYSLNGKGGSKKRAVRSQSTQKRWPGYNPSIPKIAKGRIQKPTQRWGSQKL